MSPLRDRYELIEVVGQGAQARTWRARDIDSGGIVAVKELSFSWIDDWKAIELFEREGDTLEDLDHPGIPQYVDAFAEKADEGGETFYLVQEFVEGENIKEVIERGERFTEDEAIALMRELLAILEYMHELNPSVVHRDIKPSNLIRRDDGRLALIDFGAIQVVRSVEPEGGSTVVGTTGYMPHEQLIGRALPASDLYAVGATVVHLLSHLHPADLPVERMRIQWREAVQVGEPLASVLDRLLQPAIEDRFSSAREVLDALDQRPSPNRPAVASPESTRSQPATPGFVIAGAVMSVLVTLGVIFAILFLAGDPMVGGIFAEAEEPQPGYADSKPSLPLDPVDLRWSVSKPAEVRISAFVRDKQVQTTDDRVSHKTAIMVRNDGRVPIHHLELEKRMLREDGSDADTERATVIHRNLEPMQQGHERVVHLDNDGPPEARDWEVVVTKIATSD